MTCDRELCRPNRIRRRGAVLALWARRSDGSPQTQSRLNHPLTGARCGGVVVVDHLREGNGELEPGDRDRPRATKAVHQSESCRDRWGWLGVAGPCHPRAWRRDMGRACPAASRRKCRRLALASVLSAKGGRTGRWSAGRRLGTPTDRLTREGHSCQGQIGIHRQP